MHTVQIKNLLIGEGIPKICVPIIGKTKDEIFNQAAKIKNESPDLIEWRADWFSDIFNNEQLYLVLKQLRLILADTPLLFTFRSYNEGGQRHITVSQYEELTVFVSKSGFVDVLDIEAYMDNESTERILKAAKDNNVKTILSNHNFDNTPDKEEIIRLLCNMQDMNPDMIKLAVMPKERQDILILLAATDEMIRNYANVPVITMSMSAIGAVSRFTGELFGSSITFASAGHSSAPGQADIKDVREVLKIMHNILA